MKQNPPYSYLECIPPPSSAFAAEARNLPSRNHQRLSTATGGGKPIRFINLCIWLCHLFLFQYRRSVSELNVPEFQQKTAYHEPKRPSQPTSVRFCAGGGRRHGLIFNAIRWACTVAVRNGSSVLCNVTICGSKMLTTVTTYAACFGNRTPLSGVRAVTNISE